MKIGENVKIKASSFYAPPVALYAGQVGVIIAENIIDKSTRYKVRFADGKKLWFFEPELETEWIGQKHAHQKDLLEAKDETKKPLLKAGLVTCLQELNCESAKAR